MEAVHTFTAVRDAHNLSAETARREYPVHLRAVVAYYDPYIDIRRGSLFVCDHSGCTYVSVPKQPVLPLHFADLVDITGVTGPGDFTAIVVAKKVSALGHSSLPANPPRLPVSQMLDGVMECSWVEVEGRVRSVQFRPHNVVLQMAGDGGSFDAVSLRQEGVDYESMVDSLIRIRGISAPVSNQHRQMVGAHVFFPDIAFIKTIQAAARDPFAAPPVPISQLFSYSPDAGPLRRVHVRGRITLYWPGRMLCIQDASDGICAQTEQTSAAALGTFADVAGFPAIDLLKPTLEDAVFRSAGGSAAPPLPVAITGDQAITGDPGGKLIAIDAELIGRDSAASDPTFMLRAGSMLFPAILPAGAKLDEAHPVKNGSLVRITGVCDVQVDPLSTLGVGVVRLQSVRILIRSIDDIAVLRAPSWWTAEHTLYTLAAALLMILASLVWIAVLRRTVTERTVALRVSEQRLRHLSEHDTLTGLPNRLLLNDRLQTSLTRAQRFQSCLGLLMIDVDAFKEVNDALGHQAGDELLRGLAGRLTACLRATDTVARIGGDEFIVVLPDLHFPAEAEIVAAKIIAEAARPIAIDGAEAVIHVSLGVVTYPHECREPWSLMRCADEAMYAAKRRGKNCFQVYRRGTEAPGAEDLVNSMSQVRSQLVDA